jgi:small subunit ribosomal protein S3
VGQKTHPYGFRLVYNKTWHSRWYGEAHYADTLHEDLKLRRKLKARLGHAGVSEIDIERAADKLRVTIYTSRPGIIIGRRGAEVDKLRDDLQKEMGREVHINIQEIQRPELDAQLVAESIAGQLQRRVSFRRAMKKAMESAFRFGAKGVKIMVAGRLGGAEIARTEWYREGRVPLHTLRADIDFGEATAKTTYGTCGVKVWVFKGEILAHDPMAQDKRAQEQQTGR